AAAGGTGPKPRPGRPGARPALLAGRVRIRGREVFRGAVRIRLPGRRLPRRGITRVRRRFARVGGAPVGLARVGFGLVGLSRIGWVGARLGRVRPLLRFTHVPTPSGPEHPAADGRQIAEDPYSKDDYHTDREQATHAQLVPEEHD